MEDDVVEWLSVCLACKRPGFDPQYDKKKIKILENVDFRHIINIVKIITPIYLL
jgi:hypothetical protein